MRRFIIPAIVVVGVFVWLVLRGGGAVDRLPATAVALGVLPGAAFAPSDAGLAPGDRLFLYTDGVTEAFDAQDREYGDERLQAFLARRPELGPAELVDAVVKDVLAFGGPVPPHDDITLMVALRRLEREAGAA